MIGARPAESPHRHHKLTTERNVSFYSRRAKGQTVQLASGSQRIPPCATSRASGRPHSSAATRCQAGFGRSIKFQATWWVTTWHPAADRIGVGRTQPDGRARRAGGRAGPHIVGAGGID